MKHLLTLLLIACSSLAAAEPVSSEYKNYIKSPIVKSEELQKILFSVSSPSVESSPPYFRFRLYNGLSDKTIIGIVVTVTGKPSDSQAAPQDIFIPVELAPLAVTQGDGNFFATFSEKNEDVHFALKEVRYKADKG